MTSVTAFFEEKWKERDDVTSFLARLAALSSKVNACKNKDVTLSGQLVMGKALACLPPRYSSFKSSWYMMSDKNATLETFREKLLIAERGLMTHEAPREVQEQVHGSQLHQSGSQGEPDDALVVGKKKWKKKSGITAAKDKFEGDCYHCGKAGHRKVDCFKFKKDSAGSIREKSEDCVQTALIVRGSSDIVADSGASRHITGQRSWFKSLQKLNPPIPLTTADNDIHATHEGEIDVTMSPDGNNWIKSVCKKVLLCQECNRVSAQLLS